MYQGRSIEKVKRCLLLTVEQVPKPGKGGPGAVIERLTKVLQTQRYQYGWQPIVIISRRRSSDKRISLKLFTMLPNTISIHKFITIFKEFFIFKFLITYTRIVAIKKILHHYMKLYQIYQDKILSADIIHCHDIFSMISILRILKKLSIKKPVLLSIHSPGSTTEEILRGSPQDRGTIFEKYLKSLELYAISSATALIMPSYGAYQLLLKDLPEIKFMKKEVFIIYNGVEPIEIKSRFRNVVRRRLGLDSKDFLIVAVGRLVHEKGFDVLVRATKYLYDSGISNIHVAIAGDGPQRKILEKLVESLDLKTKVHFLGYVKDISEIYSAADVFVSSARRSAFDLTLIEALSAGVPVIATDVGGNKEAIGDAGVLIKPEDPEALARALMELIKNRKLRENLSLKAVERFKKHFSTEKMVHSYVQLLNHIVLK